MDDIQPDFDISYLEEMCTAPQKLTVSGLIANGWIASHIWEYQMGFLAVWLLRRPIATTGQRLPAYVHCYITPDGKRHSRGLNRVKRR